jgi:uncharacterized protein YgbK (DUF1537 family)
MDHLVILADDLTGAADAAASFAQAGLRTVVALSQVEAGFSGKNPASFEVISLSTDSRQVEADEAARRVRQAVDWLRQNGFESPGTFFYKKIDSLLRGHPAVELAAMLDALGFDRALVAPAFPAQGRATLAGRQVVGTGEAARQIDLAEIFEALPAAGSQVIHWLALDQARLGWRASQPGLYIADAASETDLEALASAMIAQGFHLACGSAGLARALQRVHFQPQGRPAPASHPARPRRPVLVVAGSRAPVLARQVEAARQSGLRVVIPGASFLEGTAFQPEELAVSLAETLRSGQPAILTTAGLPLSPLGDETVARRLAEVAGWLVEAGLVGGLALTGGDTAAAVCRQLGASLIELYGEPAPGIAAGSLLDGKHAGLPVITKAGAFECDLKLMIGNL